MKFLTLTLLAVSAFAAPWDGTRGDLTVFTVELTAAFFQTVGAPTNLPPFSTEILVSSTDKTVTAFRVAIEYTDANGHHTDSRTTSVGDWMTLAFFSGVKAEQITSVTVTRLRDGVATNLVGQ